MNDVDRGARPAVPPGDPPDRGIDEVAALLQLAGARPQPPGDRERAVRTVVERTWQGTVRRRRRWRVVLWTLASSSAAAAIALALLWRPPGAEGPAALASRASRATAVARVERLAGEVAIGPPEAPRTAAPEGAVAAGDRIATGADGRVALLLAGGGSLRVDASSRLALDAAGRIELGRGAVYFDSGLDPGAPPAPARVVVATPLGTVSELGTQFEVRLVAEGLRVRVREGEVALRRLGRTHTADAGVELTVTVAGVVHTAALPAFGAAWEWTQAIAPPFPLEGSSLSEFLAWVSRESGRRVAGAAMATGEAARTTVLHGSLAGLTPEESLAVVLPSCGLGFHLDEASIRIGRIEPVGSR